MNKLESKILNIIQQDFPVELDPYKKIAELANCTKDEAYNIVIKLKDDNIIRRIGGSFGAKQMGYKSILVAANIKSVNLASVAEFANQFNEITHNYERNNKFNLWFTIIAENNEKIDDIISAIKSQKGVNAIHKLPAEKLFKLRVDFEVGK